MSRGESWWWFLFVLAALGSFVHERNQRSWNVQHAWVESLAERGVMHLEGSPTPRFALSRLVDVWVGPDEHTYARNAPGTFFAAAAVHAVLFRVSGLRYRDDFDLTSAIVTFLTTCLASAVASLLLFLIVRRLSGSALGAACVAGAYSFGTLAFPYSGHLYQHQTAVPFFLGAFALGILRRPRGERWFDPVAHGALLGLGLTFSFASAPLGLAIAGYCLWPPSISRAGRFLAGLALALTPLLLLNAVYYGGPLTTVYQAARDYQVTTLDLSAAAVLRRLHFYFSDPTTGLFFYCPILLLSVPGLLAFPRELRREALTIAAGAALTFAHLLVASGIGAQQFGPRLVLPLLPYLALGLFPYWRHGSGRLSSPGWRLAFGALLVPSIAFCTLGALGMTAYRDVARHNAWYVYLRSLWPPVPDGLPSYNLTLYRFPLRPVLAWVAVGLAVLGPSLRLAASARERRRRTLAAAQKAAG